MAQRVAERLVACFCGCSELEVKEVRRMTQCNIVEFLSQPEARRLLAQYIIHELMDEEDNLTLKYLRMYEYSLEYIQNPQRDDRAMRACRNNLEDIEYGYPSERIERRVKQAFRSRNLDAVYDVLRELQRELENEIELSSELEGMKEKLLTKIEMALRDPAARRN